MYDYVKQHRWATLRVGMVITMALLVIFLAVMFAGDIEKFFAPKLSIYAVVDDVRGLREGSPVWFSGVEIGSVRSIRFTIHNKIQVEMLIMAEALKYLRTDSRANILTLGLLGDKYVEITPGSKGAEDLRAGEIIRGRTPVEIQDVVETSQMSIAKIADFVDMLEKIIVKIERGEGSVAKFIQDPAVYDNLKEATGELKAVTKKIEQGQGTMGRLLNEDELYVDLASSARDIKLFARSLKESDLNIFTHKLATSRGTVNKLIEDESLYDNINSASENLDSVLARIDKGEGLMGSLVSDDELAEELKTTLRELNALIRDIKENPNNYFKFSVF
jgi:phospholipid/cholesterol/gamma-HCH transport system substrate-binding protein